MLLRSRRQDSIAQNQAGAREEEQRMGKQEQDEYSLGEPK